MNIKISKSVLFAILAAIFALGAYWYWSPFLVIRQMQSAAKVGDADAFNDHVDYPRLRESLKGHLNSTLPSTFSVIGDRRLNEINGLRWFLC